MKIYVCDKCGKTHRILTGITGSEFENHGFQTLAKRFQTDDIVDLCRDCMSKVEKARASAIRSNADSLMRQVRSFIVK